MRKYIVVKLQVEGLHNWPEAREVLPEMGFLSDKHRHMFHIKMIKEVLHNDRDIEIIQFKRKVQNDLNLLFYDNAVGCIDFGRRSCEDLAELLIKNYDLTCAEVLEDGENGAIIYSN